MVIIPNNSTTDNPGMRPAQANRTTDTKLDDELCAFFKKNNFLIGLSVDGPREIHDTYRVNKAAKAASTRSCTG